MSNIRMTRVIAGVRVRVETHHQPHLDEIAGLWLIEKFADGAWVQAHCPKNQVRLGIGLGEFDEHGKAERVSCFDLVAKSLGIDNDTRLAQIRRIIFVGDIQGQAQPDSVYAGVKLINLENPGKPRVALDWAYQWLSAKYAEQNDFHCSMTAVETGRRVSIIQQKGGEVRLLVVQSDCKTIVKAAMRLLKDVPPDVIVQQRLDGHVMIFTNKKSRISLALVIAELRTAESRVRGRMIPLEIDITADGFVEPDTTWYYYRPEDGEMILNGSNTAEVEPTQLTLDQVIECIRIGLGG